MEYDFRICKGCKRPGAEPRYRLTGGRTVYACPACGLHYIDHLDPAFEDPTRHFSGGQIARHFRYIENGLEWDRERFASHVEIVRSVTPLDGKRCLDIGAGAGRFLWLLAREGAEVHGVEPTRAGRLYARERYGLSLEAGAFQEPAWYGGEAGPFDLVTLWDVIEHVNFPVDTLDAAYRLLAPGGILALDTPVRDGFFHRAGQVTYRLSAGRWPTLLGTLYSARPLAHKQILHSAFLRDWALARGAEVLRHETFHEISRPLDYYVRARVRSPILARALAVPLGAVLRAGRFHNKVLLVVRRPGAPAAA